MFNEIEWKSGAGDWFPSCENEKVKSFQLSALVSPWKTWNTIVEEFLSAKDDVEMLKVWTNTDLGEPWVDEGEMIYASDLFRRREVYNCIVPEEVLVITAGVDVQDDRFEMEVVGWDEKKRSWGIEYKVVYGNTSLPESWELLDQHLLKTYVCEDGVTLPIMRVCVDSGHRTTECYQFCKDREARGVYAIKGKGGPGMNIVHTYSRTKKLRNILFTIATDTAKATLFTRLAILDEKKSGYCHFPTEDDCKYDEKYFDGLTSEIKITKMVKGRPKVEWKVRTGVRNEPLDCRVYNIAAIEILNPNFDELKKRKSIKEQPRKKRRGIISKGVDID